MLQSIVGLELSEQKHRIRTWWWSWSVERSSLQQLMRLLPLYAIFRYSQVHPLYKSLI